MTTNLYKNLKVIWIILTLFDPQSEVSLKGSSLVHQFKVRLSKGRVLGIYSPTLSIKGRLITVHQILEMKIYILGFMFKENPTTQHSMLLITPFFFAQLCYSDLPLLLKLYVTLSIYEGGTSELTVFPQFLPK